MEFLDCNLSYGPATMKGELPGCPDVGELRKQLDRAGTSGGLVYYAIQEPLLGNAAIARDIAGMPDLFGVWSLLPSCTGEIPPPDKLPAAMKQNGAAALTLDPQNNRFLAKASAIGDYLAMAQERSIPVWFHTGRGLTLEQIDELMGAYPKLTAILTYANCWPSDRQLRPFLDAYPNLYLDMAYMQTAAGLSDIVGVYSGRRVLFGSAYPECYPGAHIMVIKHAGIDDGDKALIAGGNLRRILGEAQYD